MAGEGTVKRAFGLFRGAVFAAATSVANFGRSAANMKNAVVDIQTRHEQKAELGKKPRRRSYRRKATPTRARESKWPALLWGKPTHPLSACPKLLSRRKLKHIAPGHPLLRAFSK